MSNVAAGLFGTIGVFIFALLGMAATVYLIKPLRAQAYRMFIKCECPCRIDALVHLTNARDSQREAHGGERGA